MIIAAILIHLEDGGPIFYGQWRTGLYGMPIRIWKLRSMHPSAEAEGARWASQRDPRTTRLGRWLRLMRLDELPQLPIALKGDMSLIGPGPSVPNSRWSWNGAFPTTAAPLDPPRPLRLGPGGLPLQRQRRG